MAARLAAGWGTAPHGVSPGEDSERRHPEVTGPTERLASVSRREPHRRASLVARRPRGAAPPELREQGIAARGARLAEHRIGDQGAEHRRELEGVARATARDHDVRALGVAIDPEVPVVRVAIHAEP